jgi:transcriptional regulator with XRE-family HTH domain
MTMQSDNRQNDEAARKKLGEKLRDSRKYIGLKQEDVAHFLKIPRTALVEIESGQRRVEAIELTRLAKLYKQPVSYFVDEEEASADLPAEAAYLARQAAELSPQDREELNRFVAYLKTRSKAE